MNNLKNLKPVILTLLFLIITNQLAGQEQAASSSASAEMEMGVLSVYFFLLVFATIINRILQYFKLVYKWLFPKIKLLQNLNETVWQFIKKQMDKLKLEYDEKQVRKTVAETVTLIILHIIGFVIGIVICTNFQLGAMDKLGWSDISPGLNYILTGLLIGAGVDPVHSVFRMVGEKKKIKKLYANAKNS